jgi:hypothetical protein
MGILVITTLVILLGPGLFVIIAALAVGNDRPKWKMPLLRIGVFLLITGILLLVLLLMAASDLSHHPIN